MSTVIYKLYKCRNIVLFFTLSLCLNAQATQSDTVQPLRIAVASNFKTTLTKLVADFKRQHAYQVTVSSASTGALYHQIIKGAPYDIFFAADELRPAKLVKQGLAQQAQLYAYGLVALYSAKTQFNYAHWPESLPDKCLMGIANPAYAPYGIAAQKVISGMPILTKCQLIKGSNVAQAFQFTQLQTVDLGIVAYSHILEQNIAQSQFKLLSQRFKVAQAFVLLNQPVKQSQQIQLKNSRAAEFAAYLRTPNAQHIIASAGYKGGEL